MCSASNDCAFRMAWTISSSSVMPTNPAIFMLVSFARERLATGWYRVQSRQDGLVPADRPHEKKIALAIWHNAAKVGGKRMVRLRVVRDSLPRPKKDLKFYLAPSRYRDAEQECDKQARERSFPGNGADGRKRLSGLARRGNGLAQ